MTKKNSKKLALALGGGGAVGLYYIGVLEILEENNIPISFIAGTSIGALIGGSYAAGVELSEIKELIRNICKRKVITWKDINLINGSIINPKKLYQYWGPLVENKTIEDCKIPFVATAVDIESGKEVMLNKGPLLESMIASSSYPPTFPPTYLNEKYLIDGGILNKDPADIARKHGDVVILSRILDNTYKQLVSGMSYEKNVKNKMFPFPGKTKRRNLLNELKLNINFLLGILVRSLDIAGNETLSRHIKKGKPDIILAPDTSGQSFFSLSAIDTLVDIGRKSMQAELPKLKKLLK